MTPNTSKSTTELSAFFLKRKRRREIQIKSVIESLLFFLVCVKNEVNYSDAAMVGTNFLVLAVKVGLFFQCVIY